MNELRISVNQLIYILAQGRTNGAFCDYKDVDRVNFLKRAQAAGAKNFEMEATCVAAMCEQAGIRGILKKNSLYFFFKFVCAYYFIIRVLFIIRALIGARDVNWALIYSQKSGQYLKVFVMSFVSLQMDLQRTVNKGLNERPKFKKLQLTAGFNNLS